MQVVYKIRNVVNQKFYVGSTTNKKVRFKNHLRLLRKGKHHCCHLQSAWNKYGEDCFKFEVVEIIPDDQNLQTAEDRWLIEFFKQDCCYNTGRRSDAPWRGGAKEDHPNFGRPKKPESNASTSATLKAFFAADPANHPMRGKKHTPEALAKMAANKVVHSGKDHYRYGKTLSDEVKAKISATQKGVKKGPRTTSEDGRQRILAAAAAGHYSHPGHRHTAETKEKMSRGVIAHLPDMSERRFVSLTEMRDTLGVSIASVIRGCKSGKPVKCGVCAGWVLSYIDGSQNVAPVIPEEYAALPRTRSEAKALGAVMYFTGVPCEHGHISPRKTKGNCVACSKVPEQKAKANKSSATSAGWADEITRAKRIAGIKASRTPELRAQISSSCKALWTDEKRLEQSEKMKIILAARKPLDTPKP